jgi:hypothetical protein
MKSLKQLVLLSAIATLLTFASCEEQEQALTEERKATILLSKPWEIGYVLVEGGDVTDLGFSLLTLTFEQNGSWTSTNANGLFAASGRWSFADGPNGKDLNRLDFSGTQINIFLNPEGSTLTMRFERTGTGPIGGKTHQIAGSYELYLLPKFAPTL